MYREQTIIYVYYTTLYDIYANPKFITAIHVNSTLPLRRLYIVQLGVSQRSVHLQGVGQVLVGLSYEEDSRAEVDMNVVMTSGGGLVETQATAEKGTYARAQLNEMLDVAEAGIRELLAAQKACLAGQR